MWKELCLIITIFIVTAVITTLLPEEVRFWGVKNVEGFLEPLKEVTKRLGLSSIFIMFLVILYNNVHVAILNLTLGITIVVPIGITIFNSYVLTSFIMRGNIIDNLILVLPHGVIELAAFLYSAALGLKLGIDVHIRKLGIIDSYRYVLKKLPKIILILVIAALIEVFVTPTIFFIYKIVSSGSIS